MLPACVFTYFFGLENLKAQVVMTALISVLISLNLFLVLLFGYPFSGDLKVYPDSFQDDELIFDNQPGTGNQLPPKAMADERRLDCSPLAISPRARS